MKNFHLKVLVIPITGTMFWVDPEKDLILIFLTNRVYPNREEGSFYKVDVRNKLFEIIL